MKRFAALFIAVAVLAAAPVMAQDPGHVKIAPNNKGDLLIFPFYYTDQTGIWTKFTVVNTSETNSTVAKVVIKTWMLSEETLDFLIYLSPADVWTGWLATLDDGNVYLVSYDDSMLTADGQWASLDNLVVQPLVVPVAPDGNWLGYVYVINAATDTDVDLGGIDKQVLGRSPGVLKKDIKAWYDKFNDSTPGNLEARDGDGTLIDTAKPLNILAGWMELTYGSLYNIAGLNATTLADYQNAVYIPSGVSTSLDQGDSLNTLADIEAALAKNAVAMPYVNGPFDLDEFTVHMFSFPTKGLADGVPSPYFGQVYDKNTNPLACIKVERKIYDLSENSTTRVFSPTPAPDKFCYEVQPIVTFDFPFVEGWARYNFNDPASTTDNDTIWSDDSLTLELTYFGAPVIPTLFDITLGGVFTSLRYGAWTDGEVSLSVGGTVVYPFTDYNDRVNYHYSDLPDFE